MLRRRLGRLAGALHRSDRFINAQSHARHPKFSRVRYKRAFPDCRRIVSRGTQTMRTEEVQLSQPRNIVYLANIWV